MKPGKQLRKQGYVFDEETGVYAVTPDFFKTLLGQAHRVEADEFSAPIGTQPVDEEVGINEEGDVTPFWIQQITNCETLLERYRSRLGGVEQRLHQLEQCSMTHPGEKVTMAFDMTDAPGQVGPTGDDEPFDSWAGRQIGKLSAILNEEVLDRMARRISRMEERMTAFTMEHNERLEAVEHKADWIQMTGAEAYQRLEDRMNRFGSTMDEMGDRIRRIDVEPIANGEPRYTPDQTRAYQAGFTAGRVQSVKTSGKARDFYTEEVARRVEAYMQKAFFAPLTTQAVVRVVKGEDVEPLQTPQ